MACAVGQAVRHCLNAHVRYVAGEVAVEQVSPEILPFPLLINFLPLLQTCVSIDMRHA